MRLKRRSNLGGAVIFGSEGRVGSLKQVSSHSWVGGAKARVGSDSCGLEGGQGVLEDQGRSRGALTTTVRRHWGYSAGVLNCELARTLMVIRGHSQPLSSSRVYRPVGVREGVKG